jgi:hypothetical protein
MNDRIFGVPVRTVDWLPMDTMGAINGTHPLPPNWNEMSEAEKFNWSIVHGATLVMSTARWEKFKEEVKEYTHDG